MKLGIHSLSASEHMEVSSDPSYRWHANEKKAFFTVNGSQSLAGRWVSVTLAVAKQSGPNGLVIIEEDLVGFSGDRVLYRVNLDNKGKLDFFWKSHTDLKTLRIFPVQSADYLTVIQFQASTIPKFVIALKSVLNVARRHPSSLFEKLVAAKKAYRLGGFKLVLQKLLQINTELTANPFYGTQRSTELSRVERTDRQELLEKYVREGFLRSLRAPRSTYVPKALDPIDQSTLPLRLVAFYLPQFHPFPENDAWWGKGFTEWTNVTKAQPQYLGHLQPRLPDELGFYDLRLPLIMEQQAALARHYGLHGFCFHHYWFAGKRLMELPVNNLLANRHIDINFCLCWANENWSRRWDGSESDILIAQEHSPADDIAFLEDILPSLQDPRYIRIDGRPVLIVYRASLLPDAKATAQRWREHAAKHGLPGLYLVAARSFDITDPRPYGFDAAVEFPPHQVSVSEVSHKKDIINPEFSGKIYDYSELALRYGDINSHGFTNFKSVMPSWDNEARKPGKGHVFDGASPEIYARWLSTAVSSTLEHRDQERLLFVNAWNEWAEGAHLEPDRHYGYAYLHATANVLRNIPDQTIIRHIKKLNRTFKPKFKTAIILHLYYEDLIPHLFGSYLSVLCEQADLIVTVRPDVSTKALEAIRIAFPNSYFLHAENRGRDIRPFQLALSYAKEHGYELVCKLHTKKSTHMANGAEWRESFFRDLVSSKQSVSEIISLFLQDKQLGLLSSSGAFTDLSIPDTNVDNRRWLNILFNRLHREDLIGNYALKFPAGSMYWVRLDALREFLNPSVVSGNEYELEAGQLDGTLAHAIERSINLFVTEAGYYAKEVEREEGKS